LTIFFWAHRLPEYGFLSNFYPCNFEDKAGVKYNCVTQFFVKKKQELYDKNNDALAAQIMNSTSPYILKTLSRHVKNFNEEWWAKVRYHIMCTGLQFKFSQNADLRKKLLATGTHQLVEASPQDSIWGIGMTEHEARATPPQLWPGWNMLGRALMDVRSRLSAQTTPNPTVDSKIDLMLPHRS
jgi:ribA/ribD-fused uncharacterized protein